MTGIYKRTLISKEQNAWRARKRWNDPEFKAKHTGPNHPSWRGGISANNAEYIRQRYHDGKTMKDNPTCAPWLGIYIAEQILCRVFKDVTMMPPNNKGFDFYCSNNCKIDVKSSCIRHGTDGEYWTFSIYHNTKADFFACVAFDNRSSLTPLHFWLIPSCVVDDHVAFRISNSPTILAKWAKWERSIDKIIACCNSMRNKDAK